MNTGRKGQRPAVSKSILVAVTESDTHSSWSGIFKHGNDEIWAAAIHPNKVTSFQVSMFLLQLSELRSLFSLTVRIIVFVGLISSMFEISSPTVGETWSTTPNLLTAHGQRKTGEKQTSDVHHTAHTPRFFFKIHEIILTMSKDVQHRNIEED
ncbi:hypothetical protein F2P81_011320 [Scophthalmus maximus]|uniref:Uncharacterized protein n=1 Tax=Scophthalmus maximus TaxID=52904 RepID=A0A6A4SV78_SCOMX|nr:hypothetical protein F2P81_011320 [Scophthalmus maximus]